MSLALVGGRGSGPNLKARTMKEENTVLDVNRAAIEAIANALSFKPLLVMGVACVDIRDGLDHDGDPVIFVDLFHESSPDPVHGDLMRVMRALVLRSMAGIGDQRFVHVRNHFPDENPEAQPPSDSAQGA